MSGTRCAVYGCSNTYDLNKGREEDKRITMHGFPKSKDAESRAIRKEWLKRCSRLDNFNPEHGRICSEHFLATDYERDLQHELLGLPLRKKLKRTAIPTIGIKRPVKLESISSEDGFGERKKIKIDLNESEEDNPEEEEVNDVFVEDAKIKHEIIILDDINSCTEQVNTILKDEDACNTDLTLTSSNNTDVAETIDIGESEKDNPEEEVKDVFVEDVKIKCENILVDDINSCTEQFNLVLKKEDFDNIDLSVMPNENQQDRKLCDVLTEEDATEAVKCETKANTILQVLNSLSKCSDDLGNNMTLTATNNQDEILAKWRKQLKTKIDLNVPTIEIKQEKVTNPVKKIAFEKVIVKCENEANMISEESNSYTEELSNIRAKNIELEEKYAKLLKEHNKLKSKHKKMQINFKNKIKMLHDQVRYFKIKSTLRPKPDKPEINAEALLRKILTENQIALLSKKRKVVYWTKEEISVAFRIRYYSTKCYLYLKNKLHYPLPSLTTLRKSALKLSVRQEVLKDILLTLKER